MGETILSNAEIDNIIQNFEISTLEDIGSLDWFNNREKIYQLYQVTIFEKNKEIEERVPACVKSYYKIEILVKDLFTLSVWIEKVMPLILNSPLKSEQGFPLYLILHGELILLGLIQSLLYENQLVRDLKDLCLDLIDYAAERIKLLDPEKSFNIHLKELESKESKGEDFAQQIKDQKSIISFNISTGCIAVLRVIAENLESLPLKTALRIYNIHDVPLIITQLIEKEVWTQRKNGDIYKYQQNSWKRWRSDDPILSNVEIEMWLLMSQLFLNNTFESVYNLNNKKDQLSRLNQHLNSKIINQLSVLENLKLWLQRFCNSNTKYESSYKSMEMDDHIQFREALINKYEGQWTSFIQNKSLLVLDPEKKDVIKLSKFVEGLDKIDKICEEIHRCTICFDMARKRCSRCKDVWYCSRRCQVNHWHAHKKVCCK